MVFVEPKFYTLAVNGCCRIVNVFKETKIMNALVMRDLRVPFLGFFVPVNSRYSADVCFASCQIHAIRLMRNISKICNLVIESVAINVVNKIYRPLSIKYCPGDSVGLVSFPENSNAHISAFVSDSSGNFTSFGSTVDSLLPSNFTCVWVVVKNGFERFRCDHGYSLNSMCGDYKP